jgi:hypothetical protein
MSKLTKASRSVAFMPFTEPFTRVHKSGQTQSGVISNVARPAPKGGDRNLSATQVAAKAHRRLSGSGHLNSNVCSNPIPDKAVAQVSSIRTSVTVRGVSVVTLPPRGSGWWLSMKPSILLFAWRSHSGPMTLTSTRTRPGADEPTQHTGPGSPHQGGSPVEADLLAGHES